MDEISLLRRARPEVPEPTVEVLAHARARLLAHAEQVPQERADRLRDSGSRRRSPRRTLALAGIAAALAAVVVSAPFGGQQAPAGAAGLLTEASRQVGAGLQPSSGQYLKITTRSESLSYLTDDDGQVTGAYVVRTVGEDYVPADRSDEWVEVSYSLPAQTFYGDPSVEAAARRDYAQSAQVDDPNVTRAARGQFGNGEPGGPSDDYATTADLPSLPRTPSALLEDLSARSDGADSSTSVAVMAQITTLLSSGLVDAELTAVMYQTLALLPEVQVTDRQATLDGRKGTAVGVVDDEGFAINEVIIDPAGGGFLGVRSRQVDAAGPIPAGAVIWSTATTSTLVGTIP